MSGIQMTLLGGGVSQLDVQTVTTGSSGTAPLQDRVRGYNSAIPIGSIVDGTSNIYGGATIASLFWDENGGAPNQYYYLAIVGATNTGWTTLTIGSLSLLRTAATFGVGANWTWTTTDIVSTQAFGINGATVICTFS